ncbi:hypothetical protein DFJ43DRAFT_223664 [Lentinula guzmanii]|uniref:Uncharacterized protein n=1 Tax=Lentinula guzmanii TaxID=2804957 RepID=A0AA38JLT5_9AGAR|nr:hypothetical protein DFJ43DRAFT_223664 [Lentinula guzmanii]
MLFAVTTSRLFTLLYLCVSMLTASGSPLAIHGTTYFDGDRVDVDLGFEVFENAEISHAFLAIGDTMIHADFFNMARKQMVPKKIVVKTQEDTTRRDSHWAHLGKAKFKSPADQQQALQALLSIKLPPYKETGGKAWDYIQSALQTLKERGELLNPDAVVENSRREKEELESHLASRRNDYVQQDWY